MLFEEEVMEKFRETPEIKAYLSKQKKRLIYFSKEILSFLMWSPVSKNLSIRIPSHLSNFSKTKNVFSKVKNDDNLYRNDNMKEFISKWTTQICGHGISNGYGSQSLFATFSDLDGYYDAIFIVDEDYLEKLKSKKHYASHSELVEEKLKLVHSVMIVKEGECQSKPNTVAIKLICSRKTMKANILMGAYLYAIKNTPLIDQTGVLELAGGFSNLPAYCLYTKFGFVADKSLYVPVIWQNKSGNEDSWKPVITKNKDLDLYVPNPTYYNFKNQIYSQKTKCFGEQTILAMSVDLNPITVEAIIKTTTKNKPIHKIDILHPKPQDLCTTLKGKTPEEIKAQMDIANLYSTVHNAELDIANRVYNTGQVIQYDRLEEREKKVVEFKKRIDELRSTFRRNPRVSPSVFKTRKSMLTRPRSLSISPREMKQSTRRTSRSMSPRRVGSNIKKTNLRSRSTTTAKK